MREGGKDQTVAGVPLSLARAPILAGSLHKAQPRTVRAGDLFVSCLRVRRNHQRRDGGCFPPIPAWSLLELNPPPPPPLLPAPGPSPPCGHPRHHRVHR